TTYVATKLSLDGVLKEYGLKIIIPHGGGFIPYQLARFDMAHEVYKLGLTNPSGDLKKNVYYDTVVYSRETLEFLEKIMGIDKVVYGTDHPFPVSFPDLFLKLIQEVNPKDEDREKILTKNAKELFKLKNL
ncbi:MAG: amidohydrolase family protein, partial [Metallosphaera prunae]|uniref:amidohydrolase family protein n=1 Tax=Metallosphaera prunae TaxID=47304 RepID=UPI0022727D0E